MFGFLRKTPTLSAEEKAQVLSEMVKRLEGDTTAPLRVLVAEAMGNNTGPDSLAVTNLLGDIRIYCGLPNAEKADLPVWWRNASATQRKSVLETTRAYIISK